MRTVKDSENITVKVTKDDLIEGRYITYIVLSKLLAKIEQTGSFGYKSLRVRFYNSSSCGKYNTAVKAGLSCIDVITPMKSNSASLILNFEVE